MLIEPISLGRGASARLEDVLDALLHDVLLAVADRLQLRRVCHHHLSQPPPTSSACWPAIKRETDMHKSKPHQHRDLHARQYTYGSMSLIRSGSSARRAAGIEVEERDLGLVDLRRHRLRRARAVERVAGDLAAVRHAAPVRLRTATAERKQKQKVRSWVGDSGR
eukprot:3935177-Rhodomonas_salina.7